jgi:hypothetical protein
MHTRTEREREKERRKRKRKSKHATKRRETHAVPEDDDLGFRH